MNNLKEQFALCKAIKYLYEIRRVTCHRECFFFFHLNRYVHQDYMTCLCYLFCKVGILDEERILPVGKMITAKGLGNIH